MSHHLKGLGTGSACSESQWVTNAYSYHTVLCIVALEYMFSNLIGLNLFHFVSFLKIFFLLFSLTI